MFGLKRFVIKLTIMFFLILFFVISYNQFYEKYRYKDNTYYTEEKFTNVPHGIQICNFGSSHGVYGFDYTDYSNQYTTFNFALLSQTLSYDYRIMQQYEDCLANNGIAFIVVSYFSFGEDEESHPNFVSKNKRYYSFLSPQYIKQYDFKEACICKFFNVLYETPETVVHNIWNSKKKGQDSYQTGGTGFDYIHDAEAAFSRHHLTDSDGNLIIRDEEINSLYGMIRICKNHNIRAILVTPPFRSEYNELFDDKYYNQFHEVIENICRDERIEYYDYSHDERFCHSDEYTRNADHLTPKGAVTFTDILIEKCTQNR